MDELFLGLAQLAVAAVLGGVAAYLAYAVLSWFSRDLDEALELSDAVRAHNKARGAFGDGTIQGLFIRDHADDYIPRGIFDDDQGLHVAALQFEIVGYQE